jgi:hypothetical protein
MADEKDKSTEKKPLVEPVVEVVGARTLSEPETLPTYGVDAVDIDYQRMLTQFQERAKFIAGIKKVAVAQTYPSDWLGRKAKDGSYNYDLMGPGAERIKSVCPIGFSNIRRREEKWVKESGAGYTIYYEADVYIGSPRTGAMPVLGSCASDDDFFSLETSDLPYNPENPEHKAAIESGEGRPDKEGKRIYIRRRIPAAEVTREHIEKSSLTNLFVNAVTRVLGLRKMNAQSLREYGIDPDKVPSFEYGSKRTESGRLAPAVEEKRTAIWRMLTEMHAGNEEAAAKSLQGWTAFKDFPGVTDVKRLSSEKQIEIAHGKIKQNYDAWTGEKQAAEEAKKNGGTGKRQNDLFPKS